MSDTKKKDTYPNTNAQAGQASSRGPQSVQGVASRGVIETKPSRSSTGPAAVGPTPHSDLRGSGMPPFVRTSTPPYPVPIVKPAGATSVGQSSPARNLTPSGSSVVSPPSVVAAARSVHTGRTLTPANQPSAATVAGVPASEAGAPVRTVMPAILVPEVLPRQHSDIPVQHGAQDYPVPGMSEVEPGSVHDGGPRTLFLDGSMVEAVRARAIAEASAARRYTPAGPLPAASSGGGSTMDSAISVRTRALASLPARIPVVGYPASPGVSSATGRVPPAQIDVAPFVLSKTIDPHLPMLQEGSTARSAAFRALRRRVAEQKDPRVILVTSAQSDEGKTTCAVNLALALAESGRQSILLVEANLRRPKVAAIFGFRPARCLRTQLLAHRKNIDLSWLTTKLQPIGLHVLAAEPDVESDELLHIPTFGASLARWRSTFDYVVIDGPSILESCDASIIHDSVDAVLMVVRSGFSRNRTVRRALDQISVDRVAGMVLMDSLGK